MPGPSKTKGTLKNTRFKSRMRRNNTTQRRRHAFYLNELDQKQKQEYLTMVATFALYISRKLEMQGKIKSVETCDGSFDTYYNTDDAWKITHEIFKKVTTSQKAERLAHSELRQVKKRNPKANINLKLILLLLLTSMTKTTDAKWTEWSSPPGEISKYDAIGAGLVGSGMLVLSDAIWFPPAGIAGAGMIGCGLVTRGIGSAHRLIDHARGVHPLTTEDAVTEALGVLAPGSSGVWRDIAGSVNRGISRVTGEAPRLTFARARPGLGENITPAIAGVIAPIAEQIPEFASLPPAERNNAVRAAAEAAQGALESGIEYAPGAGITALGAYAEMQSLLKPSNPAGGP